jgi:hypothetical protein
MPWLANMLTSQGILGKIELLGHRPTVLPLWFRQTIAAVVWILTAIILADTIASLSYSREAIERFRNRLAGIPLAAKCIAILTVAYTAVLLSRAGRAMVFDRYTLPLVPLFAIVSLLWWQNTPAQGRTRRLSWAASVAVLGMYTLYAIAATQEVLSLARARAEVMDHLRSAGFPETTLNDGIEQMAWTHLEIAGYINNPDSRNPPGAYHEGEGFTPSITGGFEVDASPDPRSAAVLVGDVKYFSLLPPFQRRIYIYRAPPQGNSP